MIGRRNKLHWRPLIERIQKRLTGWRGKLLSLRVRITIINVVFSSIPTYFLSFFPLSRWVERKIDSIRRKVLWGGTQKEEK